MIRTFRGILGVLTTQMSPIVARAVLQTPMQRLAIRSGHPTAAPRDKRRCSLVVIVAIAFGPAAIAAASAQETAIIDRNGPEFVVTDLTTGAQSTPAVAAIGDDDLIVTWYGQRSQDDSTSVVWTRRVTHSGPIGAEVRVSQVELVAAGSIFPAIATARGRPASIIAWTDEDANDGSFSGIFGRLMNANLDPLDDAFQVNNLVTDYHQTFSSAAMRSDGSFFLVWHDPGHIVELPRSNIRGRLFGSDGTPLGDEFLIAATADGEPLGPRVVAYQEEFLVTFSALSPEASTGNESYDIYVRAYDIAGNGAVPFRVNSVIEGDQIFSDIAACADGRFVIVWQSAAANDDPDVGIHAQWFDAAGQKAGEEFLVNTYTLGLQNRPTVAMTPDCRAVIAWQSSDQDGDQAGVYGRLVNADGRPASAEFRINTTTQGRQGLRSLREVAVAADSTSTFFAVWASDPLSNDAWDVVGQGFCWLANSATRVCGNVSCSGDDSGPESALSITAGDAMITLKVAVGIGTCEPCRCDADSSGSATASDALRILRAAVSLPVQLDCPPCSS